MNEVQVSYEKDSGKGNNTLDDIPYIRFRTPDDLQRHLDGAGKKDLSFRAYPISGTPETFYFDSKEKVVSRERDSFSFETMKDFLCYTFQCDTEGYTHTEYVDVKFMS